MNNRKEKLLAEIQQAGKATDADRKELLLLLENKALQRALFEILAVSDAALTMLGNIDYTTDLGVKHAIKIQARASVYTSVVDEILEFATTEPQPEKEETKQ